MAGRPRSVKALPPGFRFGQAVKVKSGELRSPRLGLISHACKYDDGVVVLLTTTAIEGVAEYVCIQTANGDMLESVEV
jgi:hypothetical protein